VKKIFAIILSVLTITIFSGFWSGKTKQEIKHEYRTESAQTLKLLYKHAPEARQIIKNAYGYATFSNVGVNIIILSAEGGRGLAHNNKTGKNIYMNMGSAGIGVGIGIKDFRAVFIFANKKVFDHFVNYGWEANAQADAAAKLKDKGKAASAAITVEPGVRLYKLTQDGLVLQATIQGTKYWKDSDLN